MFSNTNNLAKRGVKEMKYDRNPATSFIVGHCGPP